MNQQLFDDDFRRMQAEHARFSEENERKMKEMQADHENFSRSNKFGSSSEDISSDTMLYIILIPIGACILIGIISLCIVFGCRIYHRRRYMRAYNGAGAGYYNNPNDAKVQDNNTGAPVQNQEDMENQKNMALEQQQNAENKSVNGKDDEVPVVNA
ncbi:uncharacterized protein CELE_F41F3.1 [Caenorhabditis elegans]|uniref:Uncharacterized protein n=1 Tax=Caenorhabditis elegans TaxID=6239 RepID=Q20283_CAEEL|nr:Uncharacterized protein CELE_F41F3.1 [Caenorhabditis elegans]CCD71015.2 Uncharacterized protein CELE_F41F3.1 [Caenorhabditis elegans]|eukprot:NP_504253.2 Uncharacterized protein CELE_F41F3.1 [Caenorhabditis elegans]